MQRVETFLGAAGKPTPSPDRCIRCGRHEAELRRLGLAAICKECVNTLKEHRIVLMGARPAWMSRPDPLIRCGSCERPADAVDGFYAQGFGRICSTCIDGLVAAWSG